MSEDRLSRYSKLFNTGKSPQDQRAFKAYNTIKSRITSITIEEQEALTQFVHDINEVLEGRMDPTYFSMQWQLPRMESIDDLRIWLDERKREAEELFAQMTEDQRAEIDELAHSLIHGSILEHDLLRMIENLINSGTIPERTEVPDVFSKAFDDEGEEDDTDEHEGEDQDDDEDEDPEDEVMTDEDERDFEEWYWRHWAL